MGNETQALKKSDNATVGADRSEKTGGATVTVASKLPMPLVLQLHDFVERQEVHAGGLHKFKQAEIRRGAPTYKIVGNAFPHNAAPAQMISNNFGITPGIPKAFWDEWLEQHKDMDAVRNGMIFAHSETASVQSMTREKEGIITGFERIDRDHPERHQKGIKKADREAA